MHAAVTGYAYGGTRVLPAIGNLIRDSFESRDTSLK